MVNPVDGFCICLMERAFGYGAEIDRQENVNIFIRKIIELTTSANATSAVTVARMPCKRGVIKAKAVSWIPCFVVHPCFHLLK